MTAEFAAVLPAVILVLAAAIACMQVAGEQVRLQSAVADAARLFGRGDAGSAAAVSEAAPGARVWSSPRGDLVCAHAQAPASVGFVIRLTLSATSCALDDAVPSTVTAIDGGSG